MDIVERWRAALDPDIWDYDFALKGERDKAADEIEMLRAALRPFARFAELIDSDPAARPTGDSCPLTLNYSRVNDGTLTSLGHCRQARDILKGEQRP